MPPRLGFRPASDLERWADRATDPEVRLPVAGRSLNVTDFIDGQGSQAQQVRLTVSYR